MPNQFVQIFATQLFCFAEAFGMRAHARAALMYLHNEDVGHFTNTFE